MSKLFFVSDRRPTLTLSQTLRSTCRTVVAVATETMMRWVVASVSRTMGMLALAVLMMEPEPLLGMNPLLSLVRTDRQPSRLEPSPDR